jgi:hypothetical protein
MNLLSAEQDNMNMLLTQMGAEVQSYHGLVCNVSFTINDTKIFYVYNLDSKEQYYLQKLLPYPIGVGEFTKASEIIDYIENDIACYKNASKSSVFKDFIHINMDLHKTIQKMDETFLKYNVPHDKLNEILGEIEKINNTLTEITKVSSPVA